MLNCHAISHLITRGVTRQISWYVCSSEKTSKKGQILASSVDNIFRKRGTFQGNPQRLGL